MTWKTIPLPGCIISHEVGRANQINTADIQAEGRFPVVDQGQAYIAGYTDDAERVIRDGLPYVIFGDHTRCFKYVDFPFVLGADGTKVLKPNPALFDVRFFYYAALALDIPSRGYNRHFTLLRERSIPCPELEEQHQIATVLSSVQRAIGRQERLIALTAELKNALMHKLFTEGTRGEPMKQTEIGLVPESWAVTTLGELCRKPNGGIYTGPFGSVLHKNEYQDVGTPIVNPVHLIGNYIDHANVPRIGQTTAKRLERYRLRDNDLLFGRRGEIGRHGIVTKAEAGWFCGTGCFIVRVSDQRIDAHYLNAFVSKDEVIGWLEAHAAGVIMPNLSNKVLDRMPVCFPPHEEQTVIAAALKCADDKASAHTRTARALKSLLRTLLHQLITAQIRVRDLDLSVLETAGEPSGVA